MTGLNDVPPEIVGDIFEMLSDNLHTLTILARCSSTFQLESERLLYRRITQDKDEIAHWRFINTILRKPHLANHVVRYERCTKHRTVIRNAILQTTFQLDAQLGEMFVSALPLMRNLREFVSPQRALGPDLPWVRSRNWKLIELKTFEWLPIADLVEIDDCVAELLQGQSRIEKLAWLPSKIYDFPPSVLQHIRSLACNGPGLVSILPGRIGIREIELKPSITGTDDEEHYLLEDTIVLPENFAATVERELTSVRKFRMGEYRGRVVHLVQFLDRLKGLITLELANLNITAPVPETEIIMTHAPRTLQCLRVAALPYIFESEGNGTGQHIVTSNLEHFVRTFFEKIPSLKEFFFLPAYRPDSLKLRYFLDQRGGQGRNIVHSILYQ